jgi:hypothetical protein
VTAALTADTRADKVETLPLMPLIRLLIEVWAADKALAVLESAAKATDVTEANWLKALAAWAEVAASPALTSVLVTEPLPPVPELALTRLLSAL